MKVHKLKIIQPFFNDVFFNRKEFEVRKNDRDYQVGDRLQLIEFGENIENPRYVLKDIKYILQGGQYGIDKDHVVLGLKEADLNARFPPLTLSVANSIKANIALEKMKSKIQR